MLIEMRKIRRRERRRGTRRRSRSRSRRRRRERSKKGETSLFNRGFKKRGYKNLHIDFKRNSWEERRSENKRYCKEPRNH